MKTLRPFAAVLIVCACPAFGQSPPNDDCWGTLPALYAGANFTQPSPATPPQLHSNVGATNTPGYADPCGSGGHHDVFFTYTSTVDGEVRVTTCAPPGGTAGTLSDTMLAIYAPGSCATPLPQLLACNDDFCGLKSSLTFTAVNGAVYFVRVSSYWPGATGTFWLNLDPGLNDSCATAQSVGLGLTAGSTFGAPLGTPGTCQSTQTVWYAMTTTAVCDYWISVSGTAAVTTLQIFTGPCNAQALASGCSDAVVYPSTAAGTIVTIAVSTSGEADFVLNVACPLAPPSNDEPSGAVPIVSGIGPDGLSGYFTGTFSNFGATQSPGFSTSASALCFGTPYAPRSDVFFLYVPQSDGPATITATIPGAVIPGGPGGIGAVSLFRTMMDLFTYVSDPFYSGYVYTACDDDGGAGDGASSISLDVTAGTTYLVRVSTAVAVGGFPVPFAQVLEGQFDLTVSRPFRLAMDAPLGPGSIRLRNLNGPPNAPAVTFLTLSPGAFPNGWLFGLDPTFAEIQLAISSGPPFLNLLDAAGGSSFTAGPGLPPFILYGVTIRFGPNGTVAGATPPVAFAIP